MKMGDNWWLANGNDRPPQKTTQADLARAQENVEKAKKNLAEAEGILRRKQVKFNEETGNLKGVDPMPTRR